jgi:uncharacterized RDD family membrane protein YckC
MPNPQYSISTPENVDLHLELAGLGNRILACIIDTLISAALNIAIVLGLVALWFSLRLFSLSPGALAVWSTYLLMIGITSSFALVFGYYMFFEGIWQGQTPGKKITDLRVIEQNGQPLTWSSAIVRNLIRIIDQGLMLIGLLSMFLDKNERRLGDFAAGTLVIRERTPVASASSILISPANENKNLDVGRITPDEYDLLTTFLKRRDKITQSRAAVAEQLEQHFRQKLGIDSVGDKPENFLESIYASYRSRAD